MGFPMTESNYCGAGIYSVTEASRLTRVSPSRIRRWLRGYRYRVKHGTRESPPVWQGDFSPIEGSAALSFSDLIEIRLVAQFLSAGVSWRTMRKARAEAVELVASTHPFCTQQFCTNGSKVFLRTDRGESDERLVELLAKQRYFLDIVEPLLVQLDFSQGERLLRWWPMGHDRQVVLDPARSFGRPIIEREGVPTFFLASAAAASESLSTVCEWYDVPESAVTDAVEFERRLVA